VLAPRLDAFTHAQYSFDSSRDCQSFSNLDNDIRKQPSCLRLSRNRLSQSPEQSLRLARNLPGTSVLAALLGASTHHIDSKAYKETVVLIVSVDKEHYTLHKDLLCFYSDFFRAAFNGSFKEATERKIELPDVDVETFEAFQVWLYTQNLPQNESVPAKTYPEWYLLSRLWVFGDSHQIPLLQNNVIDIMLDKVVKDGTNPFFSINYVYENTASSSLLRKAVADIMAHRSIMKSDAGMDSCLAHPQKWPVQACLDTMAAMESGWAKQDARCVLPTKEKCHYHVHADGEHC
jgi:hypothetical protein